jgi:hypothetical protein
MLLVLVQEFVLGCRFVPMGRRVLACFRPQWPNLNFAVAWFQFRPIEIVSQVAILRRLPAILPA